MNEDPKTLHNFINEIANNPLYKTCANNDNRLMAALSLYFSLSHQFDFANYALKKAKSLRSDDNYEPNLKGISRECIILFNLEHAILSYNACYDTILQIIYFAFYFANDFSTDIEFKKELSECKWKKSKKAKDENGSNIRIDCGLKKLLQEIPNELAKSLFVKLQELYEKKRKYVNNYANIIKHKGGISIQSLNTHIPDIARVLTPVSLEVKDGKCSFKLQSEEPEIFNPKMFYQECVDLDDCISELIKQNNDIYEFVEYLYGFMNLSQIDRSIKSSLTNFSLPFYYNCNDTEAK